MIGVPRGKREYKEGEYNLEKIKEKRKKKTRANRKKKLENKKLEQATHLGGQVYIIASSPNNTNIT
jgi:hypothetical protein